jgi:hypothetical protein
MGTVLNNLFGKGKGNYGDVEYWHGAERAGWLMKQGKSTDRLRKCCCLAFAMRGKSPSLTLDEH